MSVLVLAREADIGADLVVRALHDRSTPVYRLDTAWFPAEVAMSAEITANGRWAGQIRTPHRTVELEEVRSIWYRTPSTFRFPSHLNPTERHHSLIEAKLGFGGVLAALPVQWVNHPHKEAAAAYKPVQLSVAAQAGLEIPATLITNNPGTVAPFVQGSSDNKVLIKTLGTPSIMETDGRKVALSQEIDLGTLADLRGVEVTTHQFQHWVPKAADIRLVVIGDRMFAFAIHAATEEARLDFRADYSALSYEPIDVPDVVALGVRGFMAAMGLVYSAMDFVLREDGRWVFLESNAGGQYGWIEQHTGTASMTDALADLLTEGLRP
ncbi:ATP-grasp ribosomal peptide maturase [Crossiella sp. CA198]|uniref:ATP-grasp ribosomal peptide maturase n=1 Tax=Crossiella sp. CA198 TaxID=3455607 RepID=UPI003F8D0338